MRWRERDGVRWLEAELPGARVAFSTRLGGVSEGAYASLNLGLRSGDERTAVLENRRRLAAALGLDRERILIARQVHGGDVVRVSQPPRPPHFATGAASRLAADGQATSRPGLAACVLVADCLPVALAGPGGVAMLHCGWRGLAAGIIECGAREVGARSAAVGPGIGPCCYEVGAEVLEAFAGLPGVAEGRMLDLRRVALARLAAAGVEEVEVADACTSCEAELFFSHRRDEGVTGRQGGFAWLA